MHADFASLVRSNVDRFGETRRFTYLREVGRQLTEEVTTYRQLDIDARAIAAWLQSQPSAQRPVVLLYDTGLDFLRAFVGCLYAGVIAVPAPLPVTPHGMLRVAGIFADADAALVLTTSAIHDLLVAGLRDARIGEAVSVAATDTLQSDPEKWNMPRIDADTIAFLQYTSGSTGSPKGVVVTHGNLLHNTTAIAQSFGLDSTTKAIGWIPHFHDMGLIGLLLGSLANACDCVYMSPMTFLKRPIRLLEAIDKYRATITAAPNFAYELIARRVSPGQLDGLDLSCLRTALNGAEPVRPATLDAIAEVLRPVGFPTHAIVPTYGLAEVTLLASGARSGPSSRRLDVDPAALERNDIVVATAPPATTLVSSGLPADGLDIRIVDPESHRPVGENRVGEIWIRGASVAAGYWNRPEQTCDDFQASTADEAPFLRTGDLGFLAAGELFVTGRLKDLIIVNGRNLYPQDIESTAREAHPDLNDSLAVAVSFDVDERELLVVILGIRDTAVQVADIVAAVRTSIAQVYDVSVPSVVLIDHRSVHRTTSGKVQRRSMKSAFLDGTLEGLRYEAIEPAVARLRVR